MEVLSSLNLKPGNDHFATFVIIITLKNNVSLDGPPSDYMHVQDLSQGMSLNDTVKLLQLFFTGRSEGDHCYVELSNILRRLPPRELSSAAISLKRGCTLRIVQIVRKIQVVHQPHVVHVVCNSGNRTYLVEVRHFVQVRHIVQVERVVHVVKI